MKKIILCLLVVLVMVTGCFGKKELEVQQLDGGWSMYLNSDGAEISKEALEVFNNGLKEQNDFEYEPLALLGTQVVAGTNYMFIARATNKGDNQASYKIVTIYKDLSNNTQLLDTKDFNFVEYFDRQDEVNSENFAGGWTIYDNTKSVLDKDLQEKFDNAFADLVGASYTPIALLGTQVVAGSNYAILCSGTRTTYPAIKTLNLVKLYVDLEGNSQIISISNINLSELR